MHFWSAQFPLYSVGIWLQKWVQLCMMSWISCSMYTYHILLDQMLSSNSCCLWYSHHMKKSAEQSKHHSQLAAAASIPAHKCTLVQNSCQQWSPSRWSSITTFCPGGKWLRTCAYCCLLLPICDSMVCCELIAWVKVGSSYIRHSQVQFAALNTTAINPKSHSKPCYRILIL